MNLLNKTLTFLFVLIFFCLIIVENVNSSNRLTVFLETYTNSRYLQFIVFPYKGNYEQFKGIPKGLTENNSIIKYCHFGRDSIYILLGDMDSTKRICMIDANKNKNFSDDYLYKFNKQKITEKTNFPSQLISYRSKTDSGEITRTSFYHPVLFDNKTLTLTPDNDLFHKYFVMIGPSESYEGDFKINGKTYKIVLFREYGEVRYSITDLVNYNFIKNPIRKSLSEKTLIDSCLISDIVSEDDNYAVSFRITDLKELSDGDLIGHEENFIAQTFQKKDINASDFNMNQYKGKYILLDFWGTWCNPCIALLPHIAKIHKQYPDLQIVSVAYETDDKGKAKIPEFVKKYEMDWVNICDMNGDLNSINTLYNISSYPTTILIAPDGKIIHRGSTDKIQELDEKLKRAFM